MRRLVLGTRGSELARAQTSLVEAALRAAWPGLEMAVEIIRTRGDEKGGASETVIDRHAGRKGLFTSEIEHALLERRIDIAVHSAKDLPSDPTAGLELGAALPRGSIEDVLIAKKTADLASLPMGAMIGTGSVRRQHQLRSVRPDLKIAELRGNVPTRLRKLAGSSWEAIILARAGLERLGYDCSRGEVGFEGQTLRVVSLTVDQFLPAGGQGIMVLQTRVEDNERTRIVEAINHVETLFCLRAEREFLRLLQGDCGTPVGILATSEDAVVTIRAQVFEDGRAEPRAATLQRETRDGTAEALAGELFKLING